MRACGRGVALLLWRYVSALSKARMTASGLRDPFYVYGAFGVLRLLPAPCHPGAPSKRFLWLNASISTTCLPLPYLRVALTGEQVLCETVAFSTNLLPHQRALHTCLQV